MSSLQSSVVEVLADQKRKGRPPKPDRPSASEKKFPCVFCEKRYGTKQSLQVKCYNIIDEMKWFIFVYQVHVSTKHRAEKKAQRGRLMGTSDFIVWFCILYFNIWHLMRIKRWIKVYAESLMLDVYLLYLGWCSKSVMLNDIWCAMTVYSYNYYYYNYCCYYNYYNSYSYITGSVWCVIVGRERQRVLVCRGHCSVVRPSQTKSDLVEQPPSAQDQPTCPPENRFESTGDWV